MRRLVADANPVRSSRACSSLRCCDRAIANRCLIKLCRDQTELVAAALVYDADALLEYSSGCLCRTQSNKHTDPIAVQLRGFARHATNHTDRSSAPLVCLSAQPTPHQLFRGLFVADNYRILHSYWTRSTTLPPLSKARRMLLCGARPKRCWFVASAGEAAGQRRLHRSDARMCPTIGVQMTRSVAHLALNTPAGSKERSCASAARNHRQADCPMIGCCRRSVTL